MTILALVLVLLSALTHATWNVFAKRAHGNTAFIWLYMALSALVYAPFTVFLVFVSHQSLSLLAALCMIGSAFFHVIYFVCLQRGYRVGELSFVYPLARGTGPLCSTISAILLLGERPTIMALIGLLLIVAGIFTLTGGVQVFTQQVKAQSLLYGVYTGLCTAAYTVVDKLAVSSEHAYPALYYYGTILLSLGMLTPFVLRHWRSVQQEWRQHRVDASVVAVLSPLAYVLVLAVLVFTPVSLVAPAREIGVLFGAFMGAHFLAEGEVKRRVVGATFIFAGIVALTL